MGGVGRARLEPSRAASQLPGRLRGHSTGLDVVGREGNPYGDGAAGQQILADLQSGGSAGSESTGLPLAAHEHPLYQPLCGIEDPREKYRSFFYNDRERG